MLGGSLQGGPVPLGAPSAPRDHIKAIGRRARSPSLQPVPLSARGTAWPAWRG